ALLPEGCCQCSHQAFFSPSAFMASSAAFLNSGTSPAAVLTRKYSRRAEFFSTKSVMPAMTEEATSDLPVLTAGFSALAAISLTGLFAACIPRRLLALSLASCSLVRVAEDAASTPRMVGALVALRMDTVPLLAAIALYSAETTSP